jgi:PAS domain-containing protein
MTLPVPKQESISWAQIRQVFNSMPLRIALLDGDYHYRYVNTEWSKFTGKPEDAVPGCTVAKVFGEEMFASVQPLDDRTPAGETVDQDGWVEHALDGAPLPR